MTPTPYERAVAGARYLDAHARGWRKKIRRRELNMEQGVYTQGDCGCVLAQLSDDGKFDTEAAALGLDPYSTEVVALGFVAERDYDVNEYAALTVAWRTVLRENVR